ncbi:related to RTM1 protein [Ramularia collo-cygni]|uniref:Related to RTM1 protein n=1 Tax=Ramularia collo-cygni TaxID=112498 RepID=A0A2D3UNN7_9PEZI|nr:related to RTM1 protein [Ramularia collo-cygni]CZT14085.1 related to RTM1 protein [Ramularia collo-cygni]
MLHTRQDDGLAGFEYYHYDPSMAAAIIFVIAFILTTALHFYQMIRTKTWFMTAFCIGGLFEVVGYIGRAASAAQKSGEWTLGPYIIQSLLLLVAPALFAASIYMELGRIVHVVEGDHALFVRRKWLTKIFVCGDIFTFMMQGAGGGLLSTGGESVETGEKLILAGLALQIVIFGLFVITGLIFHFRLRKTPTDKSKKYPWEKHMLSLYAVSILIFVRSIVRMAEYAQGWQGHILSTEWYLFVFDAIPMWTAMLVMNWIHPSEIAALVRGHGPVVYKLLFLRDVSTQHQTVQMQNGPWV